MKSSVQIVEVGLRDGLQNESKVISVADKVRGAEMLVAAGLRRIELGAFVRPEWVPQMAGSDQVIAEVFAKVGRGIKPKLEFSALVPNLRGLEEALKTPIKEIAIFAAATETFSKKNINCTIEESFERFVPVMKLAKKNKIKVRGYLSVCFGCPYEGQVSEKVVVDLAKRLYKMGCYEISIGDTIGVAGPQQVASLFKKLKRVVPVKKIAGHFHDTRGMALTNIYAAYAQGVRVFDSSLGGLGGCPYAPSSAGNVATEEVVYLFEGQGIKTGVDLVKLIEANKMMSAAIGKELPSKVAKYRLFSSY